MKGTIDLITFHVLSFEITSLATIGTDCFLQNYNSEENFQYDQCFYGNSDVKINYEDPSQNYLQGYFKNISIYSILINTMDFGTWNVFDNVTKHIFTMKFKEGAEISYAMKDIFETDEGNQSLTILGGYTVKAEVSFIGLDGVVIINIDPAENELYGIFHFVIFFIFNIFLSLIILEYYHFCWRKRNGFRNRLHQIKQSSVQSQSRITSGRPIVF